MNISMSDADRMAAFLYEGETFIELEVSRLSPRQKGILKLQNHARLMRLLSKKLERKILKAKNEIILKTTNK